MASKISKTKKLRRKVLAMFLTVAMIIGMMPTGIVLADGNICEVNGTGYETLAAALTAAPEGATITLLDSVVTDATLNVTKDVTIDMNGKNITVNGVDPAISVGSGGVDLTITGTGIVTAAKSGADGVALSYSDSKLTINQNVTIVAG